MASSGLSGGIGGRGLRSASFPFSPRDFVCVNVNCGCGTSSVVDGGYARPVVRRDKLSRNGITSLCSLSMTGDNCARALRCTVPCREEGRLRGASAARAARSRSRTSSTRFVRSPPLQMSTAAPMPARKPAGMRMPVLQAGLRNLAI